MEILLGSRPEGDIVDQDVAEVALRSNIPLIKAWRLKKGLTVDELADKANLPPYSIAGLENRKNKHSTRLEKAAAAMGLRVDQVVDF